MGRVKETGHPVLNQEHQCFESWSSEKKRWHTYHTLQCGFIEHRILVSHNSLSKSVQYPWSPAVSCRAVSVVALEGGAVGWSVLTVRVFPRIRLRTSGLHFHWFFSLGPGCLITVLSPGTSGLSTGGSCCPVISSYGKSPSCGSRRPVEVVLLPVSSCVP